MKINKQDMLNIKTLIEKGSITEGKFKNKSIVEHLKLNGSVAPSRRGTIKYINLEKEQNIFLFLKNHDYNMSSLEEIESYIKNILDKNASRDAIQQYRNDTKAISSKSQHGLYVSSLQVLDIKLNDKIVSILPNDGLGYFLFHTENIELFDDTVIVGVENYQVVWFAKRYAELFSNPNVLFVVITPYMLEWISTLKNEYIHFGDYDFAGINIYLNKIVPRLSKSRKHSMLIPNNIEKLIENYGNSELYEKQKRYKNLQTDDTEITRLVEIITQYKKCFEQERLGLSLEI